MRRLPLFLLFWHFISYFFPLDFSWFLLTQPPSSFLVMQLSCSFPILTCCFPCMVFLCWLWAIDHSCSYPPCFTRSLVIISLRKCYFMGSEYGDGYAYIPELWDISVILIFNQSTMTHLFLNFFTYLDWGYLGSFLCERYLYRPHMPNHNLPSSIIEYNIK